jgi:hypothetical protein
VSGSVGSVSVTVTPDARGWSEKLRSQLRDQTVQVKAEADTEEAKGKLDETAQNRKSKVKVEADTGDANAKIDEVARNRTSRINVKTDTSSFSKGASKLDSFVGSLGAIPALAITAGAALVPLAGVLAGITAALGAPLLVAGGGATVFGLLAGLAVKQTEKQFKVIDALQKKLGGLTKGTQAYADAQKQLKDARSSLSPAQSRFTTEQENLGGAFQTFLGGKAGGALLDPLTQGMKLLEQILPSVTPLIVAVSGAITTLLDDLSRAASGPGFKQFIAAFAGKAGHDLVAFGRIAGNAIKGVTGFILALDGSFGGGVLHNLGELSSKFGDLGANAGHSKALQAFADYFHKNGPQVAATLGSLARSIGHIIAALAPLGPPVLRIIQGIADAFNSIPIPVLTALAGATAGLIAFQKLGGLKATSFAANKLTGGKGVLGGVLGGTSVTPVRVVGPVEVVGLTPGGGGVLGGAGGKGAGLAAGEEAAAAAAVGKSGLLGKLGGFTTKLGGFSGILAEALSAPALLSLANNKSAEHPAQTALYLTKADFMRAFAGSRTVPSASALSAYGQHGFSAGQARNLLNIPDIKAVSTHLDGMRAAAANASHAVDLIGPHAAHSAAVADHAIGALKSYLGSIHDKRFAIIAETASAFAALQRIQAMRIADKSFTVYQRSITSDIQVGPGGGMGRPPSTISGGNGTSSGTVGRTPVHVHLDSSGKASFSGYIQHNANEVYNANTAYDTARHGG